ncbi:hypothetical protein OCK74_17000 [Chitinophagaceae bacterium LB-8]|uniref:Uncharacterized protein n=1 Tax=Paraflavisolibacter caeni TaxID=2982496 RepID=A0A9X3B8J6_9BACT|nr:hypothetical protein [Paraflavisolibacter caeni]MCU7550820.1 hypothetical protein [Paraflavisolibacter caeni]
MNLLFKKKDTTMKTIFLLLLILIALNIQLTNAQPTSKYHAKLVALDNVYEGDVDLNLYGQNPSLVKMEWTEISPDSTKKTIHRVQYDMEAVLSFIIDKDTFYVKNLVDDEEKVRPYYLVRKVYGNDIVALYQYTSKEGVKRIYIGLPRRDPYYVQHPFFTDGTNMYTAFVYFKDCDALYQKMKAEQDGYWFKKGATDEQCVSIWKRIIDEYMNCKK